MYEMSLKDQCLRELLEITEWIFSDMMLRQKYCLQYLKSTQKKFTSYSGGKIMGLFGVCFAFATLSTLNAI